MTNRRTTIAVLITGLTLASSPSAQAVVLGEVVSVSAIGQPVHVEIRSLDGRIDDAGDCLRVVVPPDAEAGIPTVSRARISATGSGPSAHIIISSPVPMLEPVAQLYVEDICNSRLRRHYTLLLSYPESAMADAAPQQAPARPQATASTPTPEAARRSTAAADRGPRAEGTAVAPDARRARRSAASGATDVSPTRPAAAPRTAGRGAQREADRLVVADEPTQGKNATVGSTATPAANDPSWNARERELARAVDRTIVAQMELLARIKELEQLQAELEARAARLGIAAATPSPQAPEPAATVTEPPAPPAPAEPAPAPESTPDTAAAPTPALPETPWYRSDPWLLGGLGALALGLVALLLNRRRRDDAATLPPEPAPMTQAAPPTRAPAQTESRPSRAESIGHIAGAPPLDWEGSAAPARSRSLAPLNPADEEVEEHDSAIELAEIMMSFGRVHGAAETLADFIRNNPKQAVTPWLKLLEVYRAAGLRAEFDGLARQLNKTFNVKAVTWNNFDEVRRMPDTVEKMPHIVAQLQQLWGTRDCQAYIQTLLRDNRDGTREGFPLNIIDELLLLSAILEQYLGPYRAEPEAPPPQPPSERQAA